MLVLAIMVSVAVGALAIVFLPVTDEELASPEIWRKRCAWCGRWLDGRPPGPAAEARVSHGMCGACESRHFPDDG